jgi:hypothetical protein
VPIGRALAALSSGTRSEVPVSETEGRS